MTDWAHGQILLTNIRMVIHTAADTQRTHNDIDVGVRLVKTRTRAQAWDAEILSITENGAFNYTANYAEPTAIRQDGDYTIVSGSVDANSDEEFRIELKGSHNLNAGNFSL